MCVLGGEVHRVKNQALPGCASWIPLLSHSQDNPGAQKSAPLQCRGQEVLHLPSAFFSHCWLCPVLKGATLRNAGLSTSSVSRDQGWQFRGLEYPSGATTEVRNKRGLAMPRVLQRASSQVDRGCERRCIAKGVTLERQCLAQVPSLINLLLCHTQLFCLSRLPFFVHGIVCVCVGHGGTGRRSYWARRTTEDHS